MAFFIESNMKLELFYFPECPYCQIVLSKISQLDIKDKVELLHIYKNDQARERLLTDTGRKTVPCLYIDNQPMFESADIAAWLNKTFQKGK